MSIERIRIKQIPVVFFHKQDIKEEGRPTEEDIKHYYHFDEIPEVNFKIFKTSSITGEGINEYLNWPLNNNV